MKFTMMTLSEFETSIEAALEQILPGVGVTLHLLGGKGALFDVEIEPPNEVQKMLDPKTFEIGQINSFHYLACGPEDALNGAKALVEELAHDYEHFRRTGSHPARRRAHLDRLTMGDEERQRTVFASQQELLTERRDAAVCQLDEFDSIKGGQQLKKLQSNACNRLQAALAASGEIDREQYVRLILLNYVICRRGGMPPMGIGPERLRLYGWIDREFRRLQ